MTLSTQNQEHTPMKAYSRPDTGTKLSLAIAGVREITNLVNDSPGVFLIPQLRLALVTLRGVSQALHEVQREYRQSMGDK